MSLCHSVFQQTSFCLLTDVILYQTIFKMYGSVCGTCKTLIVCNDNEGLTELITEIEEELVQFLLDVHPWSSCLLYKPES